MFAIPSTHPEPPRRPCPTGGFALPVVLTMLLLVSLLAAAGHALSTIELRRSESHRISVDAFYRADGALREYLGSIRGTPVPTASYPFPGGTSRVASRPLLRLAAGDLLYHVVSRAEIAPPGGGAFRKGVGTLFLAGEAFRPPSALLSLGTLEIGSGSARLDGADAAGPSGCGPVAAVAGLATPEPPPIPGTLSVSGEPPVLSLDGPGEARALTGLDWAGVLGPDAPEPDATLPGDPWPASASSGDPWPIVRVDAPLRLDGTHAGRGVILAPGDLELTDGFDWEGLVLVGGRLRITGGARIRGAASGGLGHLSGAETGGVALEGAGAEVAFHSCFAREAAAALGLPAAERPGAWYEEMESWF